MVNRGFEMNHALWTAFLYLGNHEDVALAVIRGDVEVGGMKTATARKYPRMGLQIVIQTPPLPGFALVANTCRMTPPLIDRLRHGAVPASDANYRVVRDLPGGVTIPAKGTF